MFVSLSFFFVRITYKKFRVKILLFLFDRAGLVSGPGLGLGLVCFLLLFLPSSLPYGVFLRPELFRSVARRFVREKPVVKEKKKREKKAHQIVVEVED